MALKMGEQDPPSSYGQAHMHQIDGPAPGNPGHPNYGRGGMVHEFPADMGVRAGFDLQYMEAMESAVKAPQKPIGASDMLDRIDTSLDGLSNLLNQLAQDLMPILLRNPSDSAEACAEKQQEYPATALGEALQTIDHRVKAMTRRIYDIRSDLRL